MSTQTQKMGWRKDVETCFCFTLQKNISQYEDLVIIDTPGARNNCVTLTVAWGPFLDRAKCVFPLGSYQ